MLRTPLLPQAGPSARRPRGALWAGLSLLSFCLCVLATVLLMTTSSKNATLGASDAQLQGAPKASGRAGGLATLGGLK